MTTLAERAASASQEETAGLLEELFLAIHDPRPDRVHGGSQALTDWLAKRNPFHQLLAINTPESLLAAAMMLAGPAACVKTQWHPDLTTKAGVEFYPADDLEGDGFKGRHKDSLALAMIAAIAQQGGL